MKLKFHSIIVLFFIAGLLSAQNLPKFSGLMFGDLYYNASAFDAAKKDLNGFQFRRIYITTDYNISDNFSSRFRLESDQGEITNNGKITVMVKDAWLQWKNIFNGSNLLFGISPTPAFDVSEGAWGHRYLEKTIMDLFGIVPSRDLGIDLKGKLSSDGSFKYWVKIGNNSGNSPESNKYKRFYGMLEFNPSPGFLITVYGDYASAAQKIDPYDHSLKGNGSFVGAAFLNYRQKGSFSIGLEGFLKNQQNNYSSSANSTLSSQSGNGISLWAYVNLSETAQLVGRFDSYDPNTGADNDGRSLLLAGVQFNPIKNVSITPNIEVMSYQASSSNGGDKSDVVPRVTFFWEF